MEDEKIGGWANFERRTATRDFPVEHEFRVSITQAKDGSSRIKIQALSSFFRPCFRREHSLTSSLILLGNLTQLSKGNWRPSPLELPTQPNTDVR